MSNTYFIFYPHISCDELRTTSNGPSWAMTVSLRPAFTQHVDTSNTSTKLPAFYCNNSLEIKLMKVASWRKSIFIKKENNGEHSSFYYCDKCVRIWTSTSALQIVDFILQLNLLMKKMELRICNGRKNFSDLMAWRKKTEEPWVLINTHRSTARSFW